MTAKGRSTGRDLDYGIALAFAYAGDTNRTQALTDDLGRRFPEDTLVKVNYLPALRAKLALSRSHPQQGGIVLNEPTGALAHLQLGRAYAMSGDTAKARAAYQDFLALWKDADPHIPIVTQAKAEYAKLP